MKRGRWNRSGPVPPNIPKDVKAWEELSPEQEGQRNAQAFGYQSREAAQVPTTIAQLQFPGTWSPPPGAQYFFTEDDRTVAVGPSTTELTGTRFQTPVNNVAVVRELTFFVNALLTTSDITFRLLYNNAPVPGHTIKIFPRAVASVTVSFLPEDTLLPAPDAALISGNVTVVDAVSYQLGMNIRGWFVSKDVARKYNWPGFLV